MKISPTLTALALACSLTMGTTAKAGFIGTLCWDLISDAFTDILVIDITKTGNNFLLNGKMETANYVLPAVGNASSNVDGNIRLMLQMTNSTNFFGGHIHCVVDATLNPESLVGPASFDCGSGAFTLRDVTLKPAPCPEGF